MGTMFICDKCGFTTTNPEKIKIPRIDFPYEWREQFPHDRFYRELCFKCTKELYDCIMNLLGDTYDN